jgi:hypothetical protein
MASDRPVTPGFIPDEEAESFFGSAFGRQQELPRQEGAEARSSPFASMRAFPGDLPMNLSPEAQQVNERVAPAAGAIGAFAANPAAATKAALLTEGGRIVGSGAGQLSGNILEDFGGYPEGTSETLGRVGGVGGMGLGLFRGPQILQALKGAATQGGFPLSQTGLVMRVLRGLMGGPRGAAPVSAGGGAAAAVGAVDDPLMATAAQMVKDRTFRSIDEAMQFLRTLNPEQAAAVTRQLGGAAAGAPVAAGGAGIPGQVNAARQAAAAGRALPPRPPAPAPVAPAPPAAPPVAPAAAPAPGGGFDPAAAARGRALAAQTPGGLNISGAPPGSPQQIAAKLEQVGSQPGGQQAIQTLLRQMPPALRAQVEALLQGAQSTLPTTF